MFAGFEQLEDRRLMAAQLAIALEPIYYVPIQPTPLVVDGTPYGDSISIYRDASNNIAVYENGVTNTYSPFFVSKIIVNANGGNDSVYSSYNIGEPMEIYGGDGNDTLYGGNLNDYMCGGFGNDALYGYTGDDRMYGEDGNDTLRGQWGNDSICGGNGEDVIHGDDGSDYIWGEAGSDKLYGDNGDDLILGGADNDTIVTIGGGQYDTVYGEGGFDSFWTDSEASERIMDADWYETACGNVHRVGSFMTERFTNNSPWPWDWSYQTPSRDLYGQNFIDPTGSANQANFSNQPLFAAGGPNQNDIIQGNLGDCYFLATLSSVATIHANNIRQSVVELGDGTYAVRFYSGAGGTENYVRVDGDLPRNAYNGLAYAKLGTGGSNWVAVMEKAWAHFRNASSSWSSIEGGWMDEVYGSLNSSTATQDVDWWYKLWNNSDSLWNYVNDRLNEGRSVTVGTHGSPTALVGGHAYMVNRVYWSGSTKMVELRNPWGYDGGPFATDGNTGDGYVHITAQQLYDSIAKVQSAYV
jgi:hypothetical protein